MVCAPANRLLWRPLLLKLDVINILLNFNQWATGKTVAFFFLVLFIFFRWRQFRFYKPKTSII